MMRSRPTLERPGFIRGRQPGENQGLSSPSESVVLAWAAILARQGRHAEAETILIPLADQPAASPDTLDLLAKVYVQQRKVRQAQALWLRALQFDPSDKHFLRALLRCADIRTRE